MPSGIESVKSGVHLALRWMLDVSRGFSRTADTREHALEVLDRPGLSLAPADHVKDLCGIIADARENKGPLGVGARLACTVSELRKIQLAAEDCATPLHVAVRPVGDA